MFYDYKIINNDLYLYLTLDYEFSKELNYVDDSKLDKITADFINTNNINFKGNNIFYVVDNIVVKKNLLNKYELNNAFLSNSFLVNIKLDDDSICEISLHEYLLSILFCLYEYKFSKETLKSVVVLYNTYAYKCMQESNIIDSSSSFIQFNSLDYYKDIYSDYDKIIDYFKTIIKDVECNYLSYEGKYILPFIHYSNAGYTIKNNNYGYLSSVKSLWDITSDKYINKINYSYSHFSKILSYNINVNSKIIISNDEVNIDNKKYNINEFIALLGIPTTNFIIFLNSKNIIVTYKGYGKPYGLSLFGAATLANNGYNYINILNYYFPKCKVFKHIKKE